MPFAVAVLCLSLSN